MQWLQLLKFLTVLGGVVMFIGLMMAALASIAGSVNPSPDDASMIKYGGIAFLAGLIVLILGLIFVC